MSEPSSEDEATSDAPVVPGGPQSSGGVPVLQRLRALSYGSRGQFEKPKEPVVIKPRGIPEETDKDLKEEEEEGRVEGQDKQVESREPSPKKEENEPELKEKVVGTNNSAGGDATRNKMVVVEDDFEGKYYDLQDKYLEVQKAVLELQKKSEEEDESKFDELEKLRFECESQKVELKKRKELNEKLSTELLAAKGELKQKEKRIGQLKEELIESGNVSMQQKHKYLAAPGSRKESTSSVDLEQESPKRSDKEYEALREKLSRAEDVLGEAQKKIMQQELKTKNLETELKHKNLEVDAKVKRQNDLLNEVHELRMSNLQKKKDVEVLEREIEMMLSEKWNSQHLRVTKPGAADSPVSEGIRYQRMTANIKASQERESLLQAQLIEKEKALKSLSETLSDSKRMSKVTENVLTKKIKELKANDNAASLQRSVDGLVKALEEQENKSEQLEMKLKSVAPVLEAVDKLEVVVNGVSGRGGAAGGNPTATNRNNLLSLPSSSYAHSSPAESPVKTKAKRNRRKTIIPVLAQLPGSSKSAEEVPTSDQKLDVFVAIQQIPFLKAMDSALQRELAEQARLRQCHAGDLIISQGETGSEAYILLEGLLEVFATLDDQDEALKVVKPGAIIGEIALLKKELRNTSVRAVTDSRLFVLQKRSLDAILAAHPEYRGGLEDLASQRQQENQNLLQSKYALTTGLANRQQIKTALIEYTITEPGATKESTEERENFAEEKSQDRKPKDKSTSSSVAKRLAALRRCESTLRELHQSKSKLLHQLSEYEKTATEKIERSMKHEESLQDDLKSVNAEIEDIKNELFATCKELEDRESELDIKEGEVESLREQLATIKLEATKEKEKIEKAKQKEKEDMMELKKKYDEAAKAEREIIEHTEKLWSSINTQQQIEQTVVKNRDTEILQKLKSTKSELNSFQKNLVFLDGNMIPSSNEFHIITPKRSAQSQKTFVADSKDTESKHVRNLKMIDDLIDQIK